MAKLVVVESFRDEKNFFKKYIPGDVINIDEHNRVARLVRLGLCVNVDMKPKEKTEEEVVSDQSQPKPKRAYTRHKKEETEQ